MTLELIMQWVGWFTVGWLLGDFIKYLRGKKK